MLIHVSMVEQITYKVLKKVGNFEIREYPEIVVATTRYEGENSAFNLLFQYISGNNKSRKKIAMTSPVISSSEKIPMTSPVISENEFMAFSLPKKYSKENTPIPINSQVSLKVIPERIIAVLRFSGKTSKKRIKKYSNELQNLLIIEEFSSIGEVFLMRYNSPFTPGFLRRNEVAIELKNVDHL